LSRVLKTVFLVATILMVACDPGMTIQQVKSLDEAASGSTTPAPLVVVRVKPLSTLIGSKLYIPEVRVTNSSGSPITVTRVELSAKGKTYENQPPRPDNYPLTIQPGGTQILEVMFQLDDTVHETFQHPADLLVHYRTGEKQQLARASVGRL